MPKNNLIKPLAISLVIILTINLILFVLGKIPPLIFWILIIIIAIFAYKVLPSLRAD